MSTSCIPHPSMTELVSVSHSLKDAHFIHLCLVLLLLLLLLLVLLLLLSLCYVKIFSNGWNTDWLMN